MTDTTVCALSTPRGKGGIAVIRISGEKALEITEKTVDKNSEISIDSDSTKKTKDNTDE